MAQLKFSRKKKQTENSVLDRTTWLSYSTRNLNVNQPMNKVASLLWRLRDSELARMGFERLAEWHVKLFFSASSAVEVYSRLIGNFLEFSCLNEFKPFTGISCVHCISSCLCLANYVIKCGNARILVSGCLI